MRNNLFRCTTLVILFCFIAALTACNSSDDEISQVEYFSLTELSVDKDLLGVYDMVMLGETPYILAFDDAYEKGIYRVDMNTKKVSMICDAGNIVAIASDKQDGIWALDVVDGEESEAKTAVLKLLTTDGSVTKSVELVLDDRNITGMETDSSGNLYVSSYDTIFLLSSDGTYLGEIEASGNLRGLAVAADGNIVTYDSRESAICVLDWDTKSYGDRFTLQTSLGGIMSGNTNNFAYYYDGEGIYSYSADSGSSKVLSWLNNDLSSVSFCDIIDEQSFLVFESGLFVLSHKEEQEPSNKETITFATFGLNQIVEEAISKFNRSSSDYRVEVIDYSLYNTQGDQTIGLTKFNVEMTSGNVPDIIDLNDLPIQVYAEKGWLIDLEELLTQDNSFIIDNYVQNVFDASKINGTLYSIVPAYCVSTVIGLSSQVGDEMGWTYSDYKELLNATNQKAFANKTQTEMLELLFLATQDRYIDWSNGQCYFTSDSFIELLEVSAEYPSSIDSSSPSYTSEAAQLKNGEALLTTMTLRNNMDYMIYEAILGDDMTFIGYPTDNGVGCNSLIPVCELGITTTASNKEGAWVFLSCLLSEDVQNNISGKAFPVMKSSLKSLLKSYLSLGAASGSISTIIDGEEVDIKLVPLSQTTVDKYLSVIESLETTQRIDTSILNIVLEESGGYFNDNKSAEEIAQLIQSRAYVYINENK